ncbi:32970_t:CDS:2, partial [Gigaspora margarita]
GKGKLRNRRHRQRRGPLIVYNEDHGIVRAFRNIPGVELVNVNNLNLLQLAPGGHLGRFVIWSQGAFSLLDSLFGTYKKASDLKKDYRLPQNIVFNSDVTRLINSNEIQQVLRPAGEKHQKRPYTQKKNPLRNNGVKIRLNPYARVLQRAEIIDAEKRKADMQSLTTKFTRHSQCINYYQNYIYVTIIYDHFQLNNHSNLDISFEPERTIIKETNSPILSNITNQKTFITEIYHPKTSSTNNSFSISNNNVVILLRKLDEDSEWSSLKFKYYLNEDEMNGEEEKWFLTNENVRKCSELVERQSNWSKASLSSEIVSTQAIKDKDGLIVQIKSKQQPPIIKGNADRFDGIAYTTTEKPYEICVVEGSRPYVVDDTKEMSDYVQNARAGKDIINYTVVMVDGLNSFRSYYLGYYLGSMFAGLFKVF